MSNVFKPTKEQQTALAAFIARHGIKWREKLEERWMRGNYSSAEYESGEAPNLQQLRNTVFGFNWVKGYKVMAVGGNSWGKGDDARAAQRALKKAAGNVMPFNVALYWVPADYFIDEMGNGHGSATAQLFSGSDARR